jgi:hypothetical protein
MARLAKQHERMKAVGFVLDDSLMQKVIAATEATRQLRLALHDIEERERPSKAPDVPAGIKARDGQPEPPAAE